MFTSCSALTSMKCPVTDYIVYVQEEDQSDIHVVSCVKQIYIKDV
jgi:hypothetical protein